MDLLEALQLDDAELWSAPRLLRADILEAARRLSRKEARYLVDAYYSIQDFRMQSQNQVRALTEDGEPNQLMGWFGARFGQLEGQLQRTLDAYSQSHVAGLWARANVGIGPVLAAGLLAHIEIEQAPTVGHIWSFAGLNPEEIWAKGETRPWNARLKTLCWKIGQSFVKYSGRETCLYGQLYKRRKLVEQERNLNGLFADQAAHVLQTKKIGRDTEAYKWYSQGQLPPAHIQQRSERWATKIFLAHYHEALFVATYGRLPPRPYVLDRLGHTTEMLPQHRKVVPGWEALQA